MRKQNGWTKAKIGGLLILLLIGWSAAAAGCLGVDAPRPTPTSSTISEGPLDKGSLVASLSAPDQVKQCDLLQVKFTITNQGDAPMYLLTWYTPFEGILGDIFKITHQEQELAYLGPLVMRAEPLPEQYLRLDPGQSQTAVVDLAGVYDLSVPGEYQIAFRSPRISHVAQREADLATSLDELGPIKIESAPVNVTVLPSGEEDLNCQSGEVSTFHPTKSAPFITLTGVVLDVSPSVRVIWLEEEVDGFSEIALTEEVLLVDQEGAQIKMNEIQQGMTLQAAGIPGEEGALLAEEVIIDR